MGAGEKRGPRRLLALLVAVAAALVALSTSAYADEEYAQEKVVSYPVVNISGGDQPPCRGTTWIGQTTGNAVQASTTVECGKQQLLVRTYVGIFTGTPTAVADSDDGCFDCSAFIVSASVPTAAPDTRYCATGVGNVGIGETHGADTVCITT
jgi:hypothetical protein